MQYKTIFKKNPHNYWIVSNVPAMFYVLNYLQDSKAEKWLCKREK